MSKYQETWGVDRYVAAACDDVDEDGKPIRNWDVLRNNACVASGFRTRAEARRHAAELNAKGPPADPEPEPAKPEPPRSSVRKIKLKAPQERQEHAKRIDERVAAGKQRAAEELVARRKALLSKREREQLERARDLLERVRDRQLAALGIAIGADFDAEEPIAYAALVAETRISTVLEETESERASIDREAEGMRLRLWLDGGGWSELP